jgi:hypothetical protein
MRVRFVSGLCHALSLSFIFIPYFGLRVIAGV